MRLRDIKVGRVYKLRKTNEPVRVTALHQRAGGKKYYICARTVECKTPFNFYSPVDLSPWVSSEDYQRFLEQLP